MAGGGWRCSRAREGGAAIYSQARARARVLAAKASGHVIARYDKALSVHARRGRGWRRGCAYVPRGKPLLRLRRLLRLRARADVG
jgi:hypothetical protein